MIEGESSNDLSLDPPVSFRLTLIYPRGGQKWNIKGWLIRDLIVQEKWGRFRLPRVRKPIRVPVEPEF